MPRIPGNIAVTVSATRVRLSSLGTEADTSIVSDSSNADSGNTPTTRLRAGNVLALRTSTGRYVEANDANADAAAVASITGSGGSISSDLLTFKWKYKGGEEFTVTGSGDTSLANYVDLLNADSDFSAHLTASDSASELKIATKLAGTTEWFEITDGTLNAEAGITNNTQAIGTDPDFVVLLQDVDQEDDNGTAAHAEARAARVGHFDESELINLTSEAKTVFIRRGSVFG